MTEYDGPERSAEDVLRAIDALRRELSGYHGQLKAHNDLERHCERQRETLARMDEAHERDLRQIAALKALCIGMFTEFVNAYGDADDIAEYRERLGDAGVVV